MDVDGARDGLANSGFLRFSLGSSVGDCKTIAGMWNPQCLSATFRRQLHRSDIIVDRLWPTSRSMVSDFGFVRTVRYEGFNPVLSYEEGDQIWVLKVSKESGYALQEVENCLKDWILFHAEQGDCGMIMCSQLTFLWNRCCGRRTDR